MSRSHRIVGTASVLLAGLLAVLLVAGCATGARIGGQVRVSSSNPGSATAPLPVDAPCASFGCRPGAAQQLVDGYSVRLWLSQPPSSGSPDAERSTPVLELSRDGKHLSWWTGRLGYGWAATVRCLATVAEPNCAVLAEVGAHAGSAELVLLRDGALVAPPQASAVFDSGVPTAADLDHDGLLDLVGVENDYQPDYANGHNFWVSYRLVGGPASALHQTGCRPVAQLSEPAPTVLLTGRCPVVAQG
ncbi:MAG: hypothetical protein ABI140_12125 [Jatrophihabitantaceae bacterium]